jgi:methylenetetrahydrofolate dehydrogenase (NADP+)/methenyltetrahydrofolate cyclohydrolase
MKTQKLLLRFWLKLAAKVMRLQFPLSAKRCVGGQSIDIIKNDFMNDSTLINGRAAAQAHLAYLNETYWAGLSEPLPALTIVDIVVGDNPVVQSYVKAKAKAAEQVHFHFETVVLPDSVTTQDVLAELAAIQARSDVVGVLIQLPLPEHLDTATILAAIKPELDIDCLTPQSRAAFYGGQAMFVPPTAAAVVQLLEQYFPEYKTSVCAIIGQGELVGKPVAQLLTQVGSAVRVADKSVADLSAVTRGAQVVISATGQAGLITGDMLDAGTVVIDAGTAEAGGNVVGDIDRVSVEPVVRLLAPVPGGVGPMTVAMLVDNACKAARLRGFLPRN